MKNKMKLLNQERFQTRDHLEIATNKPWCKIYIQEFDVRHLPKNSIVGSTIKTISG